MDRNSIGTSKVPIRIRKSQTERLKTQLSKTQQSIALDNDCYYNETVAKDCFHNCTSKCHPIHQFCHQNDQEKPCLICNICNKSFPINSNKLYHQQQLPMRNDQHSSIIVNNIHSHLSQQYHENDNFPAFGHFDTNFVLQLLQTIPTICLIKIDQYP